MNRESNYWGERSFLLVLCLYLLRVRVDITENEIADTNEYDCSACQFSVRLTL